LIKKVTFIIIAILLQSVLLFGENSGTITIHGFMSQGYLQSDLNNYLAETKKGSFEFNEAGINFSTQVTDKLRVGMQLFARDLGDYGNDEISIDWAFADYRYNNYFGFLAGKIKIAHGLYNEVRDIDLVRTCILMPRSIYIEPMREIFAGMKGAGIYGELPGGFSYRLAGGIVEIDKSSHVAQTLLAVTERSVRNNIHTAVVSGAAAVDDVLSVNPTASMGDVISYYQSINNTNAVSAVQVYAAVGGNETNTTSAATFADTAVAITQGESIGVDASDTFNARIQWETPLPGLKFSLTYLKLGLDLDMNFGAIVGSRTLEVSTVDGTVGSVEYTLGNTVIAGEYQAITLDAKINTTSLKQEMECWYTSISHRFTDWLELGTYYSVTYPDKHDKKGDRYKSIGLPAPLGWEKDICFSARIDINPFWTFKLEGHTINGAYYSTYEEGEKIHEDFSVFAGKVTFNF